MGYFITNGKPGEPHDITHDVAIYATEEEVRIAKAVLTQECGETIDQVADTLPEDLALVVIQKFLAFYIQTVHAWKNISSWYAGSNRDVGPTDVEDGIRCMFMRDIMLTDIADYKEGKDLKQHQYFFYRLSDEIVLEYQKQLSELPLFGRRATIGPDVIPVGTAAFLVSDFEMVIPVVVTDRKGFLYYCEGANDGNQYYAPSNRLTLTEEDANRKVMERTRRRNTAIKRYHLLEESENETVNKDRWMALDYYNHNCKPPKELLKSLRTYVAQEKNGGITDHNS